MEPSASPTGRIGWDVITPRVWPSPQPKTRRPALWKRRAVGKSQSRLFPRAWKSRQERGIPTFPQPRRLRYEQEPKQDISLATKSGHFNLLRTAAEIAEQRESPRLFMVAWNDDPRDFPRRSAAMQLLCDW